MAHSWSDPVLRRLAKRLKAPSGQEIESARAAALLAWVRLQQSTEQRAIGVLLQQELGLVELSQELHSSVLNASTLQVAERRLRRLVAGSMQAEVTALHRRIMHLSRLVRMQAEPDQTVHAAMLLLDRVLRDASLRNAPEQESAAREAFTYLCTVIPWNDDLRDLRTRLSRPNCLLWLDRDYALEHAHQHLDVPIDYSTCQSGARLAATGSFSADLDMDLPLHPTQVSLSACLIAQGCVSASADKNKIHVRSVLRPTLAISQCAHISPDGVALDGLAVDAHLHPQGADVQLDGLLGRSRLVERVASRAVSQLLSKYEPVMSQRAEQEIRKRVEEETADAAYRIRGMLQAGVWDRLEALDFTPFVTLSSQSYGLRSDTDYARWDQLAAINEPSIDLSQLRSQTDRIACLHQSAINNMADLLCGARIDEITFRSFIQGQFHVASEFWEALPSGRIPAAITLDPSLPMRVDFVSHGIEFTLPVHACEWEGQLRDDQPHVVFVRYELANENQRVFVRRTAARLDDAPLELAAEYWRRAVDALLCPTFESEKRIEPKSGRSTRSKLAYLHADHGWLVQGLTSTKRQ